MHHLLCLNTACSSVFYLFMKGKQTILKVMTKSLHRGNLIFHIKVGVHYRKLSKSKHYHLLLQPHHHFHGDSLFPESCINYLIHNNVCGKAWLAGCGLCLFPRQSCLAGDKFSNNLESEIWACQSLFCLVSEVESSVSLLISLLSLLLTPCNKQLSDTCWIV